MPELRQTLCGCFAKYSNVQRITSKSSSFWLFKAGRKSRNLALAHSTPYQTTYMLSTGEHLGMDLHDHIAGSSIFRRDIPWISSFHGEYVSSWNPSWHEVLFGHLVELWRHWKQQKIWGFCSQNLHLFHRIQVGSEWASRITEFVAGFNAFRAAGGPGFPEVSTHMLTCQCGGGHVGFMCFGVVACVEILARSSNCKGRWCTRSSILQKSLKDDAQWTMFDRLTFNSSWHFHVAVYSMQWMWEQ